MSPEIYRHTLDNGLAVLLQPLDSAAVISTWIFYRVGARNELPGQTGISHWVEHMTFKGTATFDKGEIARQVNRRGGSWNGFTQYDWTAYYETLPQEHWDLALRIEAERMAEVRFDPDEVESERTVVLAEREGAENDPGFLLNEEVSATALRVHPYRQPIIGWKQDLRHIAYEDLCQHYRTYYTPNNAILVVVGATEPEAALATVAAHFAAIPPGPAVPAVRAVEPPQQAERRLILRRPGPTPIIELAFPAPRAADPDAMPFLVLDAVLSGAKGMTLFGGPSTHRSARLYRALVETELAVSVHSHAQFSLDPGLFTIRAVLRADRTPEEVEAVLLAELERLRQAPPDPEELARTVRQAQAQLAYGSESTTGQAYWLGSLAVVDRPERLNTLLDEVAAVRPEDVQRVASRYLTPERRTVGWFVPAEAAPASTTVPPSASSLAMAPTRIPPRAQREKEQAGKPEGEGEGPKKGRLTAALPGAGIRCSLPAEAIARRHLPGGATLLVRENPAHPVVAVHGYVQAGGLFDPPGKQGLAGLVAQMLSRGTEKHSFREIHESLEGVGAGLEFGAGLHAMVFSGKSLAEDLPLLLDLLAEMLRRPAFPAPEWQRLRGEALTRLQRMQDSPPYVADRAFRELLYPQDHPYRRRPEGTPASVAAIEGEDLAAFHRRHLHPSRLVIAVAGDVSAVEVEDQLSDLLAGWEPPPPPTEPAIAPVSRPEGVRRATHSIPGKSQVSLVWGVPGLARNDPDYYAALVANIILGQLGLMGRLGASVRDIQGLAYTVHSRIEAGPAAGPWSVRAGVAPQNVDRAMEGIVREIGRLLEEGPTDEERADTITYLTGQLPLRLETNTGVAATLLSMERFGLGLDYVERYPGILERLTREEIVGAARRYLSTTGYALALAGPLEE